METPCILKEGNIPSETSSDQSLITFGTVASCLSSYEKEYQPAEPGSELQRNYAITGSVCVRLIQGLIPLASTSNELKERVSAYLLNSSPELSSWIAIGDKALSIVEYAATNISDEEFEIKGEILGMVGLLCKSRFEFSGNLSDLDKGFWGYEEMISVYPPGHSALPFGLDMLGKLYELRYQLLGDFADFGRKINCLSEAVRLIPPEHLVKLSWLNELGNAYQIRFDRLHEATDIDSAIECFTLANSHSDDYVHISNLGGALMSRFQLVDDLENIDSAITWLLRARDLVPTGSSHELAILRNLGIAYQCRFVRLGNLTDVEMAIGSLERAVGPLSDAHKDKATWLQNLGQAYRSRFRSQGNPNDLEQAIQYQAQAVSLTPDGREDLADHLAELGTSHQVRFDRLGEPIDLELALQCKSQAVTLTPESDLALPGRLNNLAASYMRQYENSGNIIDIDTSVNILTRAISLSLNSARPFWFNNLGSSYMKRFEQLGEIGDINSAVSCHHQAVLLTPDGDPEKPGRFSNLGNSYQVRFNILGSLQDIENAIEACYQAVIQTSDEHVDKALWFNGLGLAYDKRFGRLGRPADIDKAIDYMKQAVQLTREDDAPKPRYLYNLGILYSHRFDVLKDAADLQKAIEHQTHCLSLHEEGPLVPPLRFTLGLSLADRFDLTRDHTDLETAINHMKYVSQLPTGYIRERYSAAVKWAELVANHQISSPLEAYRHVLALIPQRVWLGNSVMQRYAHARSMGDVITSAAAAAIELGEYNLALEWLEEGRSIVWSQMLQLRTPLDHLAESHPEIAGEMLRVTQSLDRLVSLQATVDNNTPNESFEQVSQRHRRLAEEWDKLLAHTRSLRGFDNFLKPRQVEELVTAAESGDVVMVNVNANRSDALVLRPEAKNATRISLSDSLYQITLDACARLMKTLQSNGFAERGIKSDKNKIEDTFGEILSLLWIHIANPVIKHLGYTTQKYNKLPRITWCTTGYLSFLPLHAAGDYGNSRISLFDIAVSSYTPTLGSLLTPTKPESLFPGILIVGQSATPEMPDLPGITSELAMIKQHATGLKMHQLVDQQATTDAVIAGMQEYGWVHFACHGSQNPDNPTRSAFHLHDGALTLGAITERPLPRARFAFLSACQTATGDRRLSEEAVHLAAGMMMVGYRTVIATMWSIHDEDAPLVTDEVYKQLMSNGPSESRAAEALHAAVSQLRDKVGVGAFARWVPYVHIGR